MLFLCEDVGAGKISSFGVINGKFLSGRYRGKQKYS